MALILTVVLSSMTFTLLLLLNYVKFMIEYRRKVYLVTETSTAATNSKRQIVQVVQARQRVVELEQAPGPKPLPILGNLNIIGKYSVPFEAFTDLAKEYGDVYTLFMGQSRCLVVNNLDLIREVLNQNGRFFGGRPDFLRYHTLFGGDRNNSLALCDWSALQQKRRNLARKHCSPKDASSYYQKMNDVACFEMNEMMDHLEKVLEPGKDFNLKPIISQTVCNMFCEYMASTRFDYADDDFALLVHNFDEIFWEINQGYAVDFLPWLAPFYAGHMRKLGSWSTQIRHFILTRIINAREDQLLSEDSERDFTDALLKSLREDETVTRDTIIFMLEDFLGGHSAIGNLVMLTLGYIVKNPEVGEQIQREADQITNYGRRKVNLYDIEKMPYTTATISEVLRYSSSPIVPHVATEDTMVAGYGVPKDTIVFINNYELNTSEKYWTEPKKFNPMRFLEDAPGGGKCTKKNIPHFLPFSIGKRTCIGQNLVRGFSFVIIANLLQSYEVSSNFPSQIQMKAACVATPPDTYTIALSHRVASR